MVTTPDCEPEAVGIAPNETVGDVPVNEPVGPEVVPFAHAKVSG